MFFETKVRVIFRENLTEEQKQFFLINNPKEEDVFYEDDKTLILSWRYFHSYMAIILSLDNWDRMYEIWPGTDKRLELYFNREECKLTGAAYKFYIDMSPVRALVLCPQIGTLEFREIYFSEDHPNVLPSSVSHIEPTGNMLRIFVRRYYSWVWLRDGEVEKLKDAFRKETGVTMEEFYSVYEK